jgi:excisionase family DNA binding protein
MNQRIETQITPAALPIDESARYIGCGRSMLYAYIKSGRLPIIKHGKRTVILRSSLDQLLIELAEESAP